jgi:hypothetical protein
VCRVSSTAMRQGLSVVFSPAPVMVFKYLSWGRDGFLGVYLRSLGYRVYEYMEWKHLLNPVPFANL